MRTRFKKALHDFLSPERISLQTSILNDLVFQMAGITPPENERGYDRSGFDLRDYYGADETLEFSVPKIEFEPLLKLLDFLNFPREKYVANETLTLDETFLFEKLLPAFKAHFNQVKTTNLAAIAKYVVSSKPILESASKNTITTFTTQAVQLLLKKYSTVENMYKLTDVLLALHGKIAHIEKLPELYTTVMAAKPLLTIYRDEFKKTPSIDPELIKLLNTLLEGIDLFAKYNRCESILALRAFAKAQTDFLAPKRITTTRCDIIEDTLLLLAGATMGPNRKCHFDPGTDRSRDPSRIVFTFTDMTKENAAKVVDYLQKAGDDTASEGYGFRQHGDAIPKAMMVAECASVSEGASRSARRMDCDEVNEAPIEVHCIETDGKIFHDVIYPRLKTAINSLDKAVLDEYKAKSKGVFDAIDAAASKNKSTLFQPAVEAGESDLPDCLPETTLSL